MTATARIDPPDRQRRCQHDMLPGQCSWCRGIPDVMLSDEYGPPRRRHNLVTVDHRDAECASCDAPLPLGDGAVATTAGLICIVCDEADR